MATTTKHNERRFPLSSALAAIVALLSVIPPAQAAVTEAWVHRYNNVVSNANDQAFKVVCDADGDIIVTGTTEDATGGRDMLTIKYSGADGTLLWQQRYNGQGDDVAKALAVDASGNVVVTGISPDLIGDDYYTAKYAAADGAFLWERRYNGSVHGNDQANAVAVDSDGNVVVTGYSWDGTNDVYTVKYAAADGALVWERLYNSGGGNGSFAVAVDSGGDVVVMGHSTIKYLADGTPVWTNTQNSIATMLALDGSGNVVMTGNTYTTNSNTDYHTTKYAAADGALLWEQHYTNGRASAVSVDGSGNVVVTGSSWRSNNDYYTAKYAAADGALLWEQRYDGPGNRGDGANAVAVDRSGNVVVTGGSFNGSSFDYYTAKYAAADGALLWEKRYDGPANDHEYASAVTVDDVGNVVVTGFTWNNARSYDADCYTAKYAAADGTLLWEQLYNGRANYPDFASAVAVDAGGNVVMTGSAAVAFTPSIYDYDYYTAKYSAADGALLWEQHYNSPRAFTWDRPNAVVADRNGDVVVTGFSGLPFFPVGYYTAKYAAADGALLWEQRYDPANNYSGAEAVAVDDDNSVIVTGGAGTIKYLADGTGVWTNNRAATALALDGNGNVVVTGYSYNTNSNADYCTAKYAAVDGAVLWENRYAGPGNTEDRSQAVAVDRSGNAVVTGYSYNTSFNADYYTAKYSALDGALLWEQRYDGPGNGNDEANAVAVDASGNVVVTGHSGLFGEGDFYTAKYAAADGELVWEHRYNGGGQAVAVVVDASGNVLVTGSSYNESFFRGGNSDYYTAKYAAADGALLWEKRYTGPANGDDFVNTSRSLALGPDGMVAITGSSSGDFATVVYREVLPPVSINQVPTGVRLRFTGESGRTYQIERAPAVTGPWITIATPTAPIGGLIEYHDVNPLPGQAFYRTAQP